MDRIKVLMTGAGAPGGPGIIKAIQQDSIFDLLCCDADAHATGKYLCSQFFNIPKADDPDFIQQVLDLCLRHQINIIFPLVTKELFKFSAQKELFEQHGIRVIVSPFEGLNIANDKSALCKHLKTQQIPTPGFFVVRNLPALEQAVKELGYPEKNVCIKPSVSNGSRGVRILSEQINAYDLLFHHKPNNLYSTLAQLLSTLKGHDFPELLVSEYLPGEEYTIDTLVKNGEAQLILPRIRTQMNNGISVKGTFVEQKEIIHYCREIIHSLKLHGPIGLQVKQNTEGQFRILEINPRIQGTSVAAIGAGINLPLLALHQELGTISYELPVRWGTSFSRYYSEVFYD
jgi:carbamoyl-phosphate synthase large subunit